MIPKPKCAVQKSLTHLMNTLTLNPIDQSGINNIYYVNRKYLGYKKDLEAIEYLTEVIEIIGTTQKEILQALSNDFSDF